MEAWTVKLGEQEDLTHVRVSEIMKHIHNQLLPCDLLDTKD